MLRCGNKRAQSTLEYAIIIAVVVGALVAMQFYLKRGIQGRVRQSSDDIGEQFSPKLTVSNRTTNTSVDTHELVTGGTSPNTTTNTSQNQIRNVSENVSNLNVESW